MRGAARGQFEENGREWNDTELTMMALDIMHDLNGTQYTILTIHTLNVIVIVIVFCSLFCCANVLSCRVLSHRNPNRIGKEMSIHVNVDPSDSFLHHLDTENERQQEREAEVTTSSYPSLPLDDDFDTFEPALCLRKHSSITAFHPDPDAECQSINPISAYNHMMDSITGNGRMPIANAPHSETHTNTLPPLPDSTPSNKISISLPPIQQIHSPPVSPEQNPHPLPIEVPVEVPVAVHAHNPFAMQYAIGNENPAVNVSPQSPSKKRKKKRRPRISPPGGPGHGHGDRHQQISIHPIHSHSYHPPPCHVVTAALPDRIQSQAIQPNLNLNAQKQKQKRRQIKVAPNTHKITPIIRKGTRLGDPRLFHSPILNTCTPPTSEVHPDSEMALSSVSTIKSRELSQLTTQSMDREHDHEGTRNNGFPSYSGHRDQPQSIHPSIPTGTGTGTHGTGTGSGSLFSRSPDVDIFECISPIGRDSKKIPVHSTIPDFQTRTLRIHHDKYCRDVMASKQFQYKTSNTVSPELPHPNYRKSKVSKRNRNGHPLPVGDLIANPVPVPVPVAHRIVNGKEMESGFKSFHHKTKATLHPSITTTATNPTMTGGTLLTTTQSQDTNATNASPAPLPYFVKRDRNPFISNQNPLNTLHTLNALKMKRKTLQTPNIKGISSNKGSKRRVVNMVNHNTNNHFVVDPIYIDSDYDHDDNENEYDYNRYHLNIDIDAVNHNEYAYDYHDSLDCHVGSGALRVGTPTRSPRSPRTPGTPHNSRTKRPPKPRLRPRSRTPQPKRKKKRKRSSRTPHHNKAIIPFNDERGMHRGVIQRRTITPMAFQDLKRKRCGGKLEHTMSSPVIGKGTKFKTNNKGMINSTSTRQRTEPFLGIHQHIHDDYDEYVMSSDEGDYIYFPILKRIDDKDYSDLDPDPE